MGAGFDFLAQVVYLLSYIVLLVIVSNYNVQAIQDNSSSQSVEVG